MIHVLYDFSSQARAYSSAHFGSSTGPIWLDDLVCMGDEQYLDQCAFRGWGNNNCAHGEDVGVICQCEYLVPRPVLFVSVSI